VRFACAAIGTWLLVAGAPTAGAERIVLFDFELINTSLEPTHPDEEARLAMVSSLVRAEFARRDDFEVVDLAPIEDEVERIYLRGCNGCELKLAQRLGAELAGLGWVQKVSNLILNINLQVRDVASGRLTHAGTVDIRGNTDESWQRGVRYLLERRIFPE
jgi:Protein of unknown function (DUF2380)